MMAQIAGVVISCMEELFDDIEKLARNEKRVAMATLVATRGTSPKPAGAKMWVGEEGRILGSVTIGGCVDADGCAISTAAASLLTELILGVDLETVSSLPADRLISAAKATSNPPASSAPSSPSKPCALG